MGLSMHDRRVLADIEQQINENDPRLAMLLASFGRSAPGPRAMAALRRQVGLIVKYAVLVTGMSLLVAAVALHNAALLVAAVGTALGYGLFRWAVGPGQHHQAPRGE
jgi:Flp pilus assembly protein TadB